MSGNYPPRRVTLPGSGHQAEVDAATLAGPVLPYGGRTDPNSGWSGSDTSEQRAHGQDADGTTSKRQAGTLDLLARWGGLGATWRELADWTGWHHGQASGVLSVLHKAGRIARLTESRGRCRVYVLPEHVHGRPTEAPRPQAGTDLLDSAMAVLRQVEGTCGHLPWITPEPGCASCAARDLLTRYDATRKA